MFNTRTLFVLSAISSMLLGCPPEPARRTLDRDVRDNHGSPTAATTVDGGGAPVALATGTSEAVRARADGADLAGEVAGRSSELCAWHTRPVFAAARRRVAVAAVAGSIPASYRLPGGKVSDAQRKAARKRRRRLKPGELDVRFPKASRRLKVQLFDDDGAMRPAAYVKLTELLTDPRQGAGGEDPYVAYDPRLFTILYYVAQHFDRPIEVISAFRTTRRTRSSSNHTKGRALDFVVQKVPRRRLLAYVERSFSRIGVGWYPRSTFIHVDVRRSSYYWVDRSKPGRRQRPRRRRIGRKPRPGSDPTARTIHLPLKKLYRKR